MVRVMIRAPLRLLLPAVLGLGLATELSAGQQQPKPGSSAAQKQGQTKGKPAAPAQSAPKPAASGQSKPAAPGAGAPGGAQVNLLQAYGDWSAYATPPGRTKVCYALSHPKSRLPSNLKDVQGFMFVATRPAERVKNEISLIMNFDLKEGVDHQAVMGRDQYVLVAKGKNLWVKNPAEEGKVLESMKRANDLVVKGASAKGNATSDRYSLKGFGDALDRVQKECR
jgi:hypothetical protein